MGWALRFAEDYDEYLDENPDEALTEVFSECARYVQDATHVGCDHPHEQLMEKRFSPYVTKLVLGNQSFPEQIHDLKAKVSLVPVHRRSTPRWACWTDDLQFQPCDRAWLSPGPGSQQRVR
ncbi:unnamed protein product [Merluccius merluccius]